VDLAGGIEPLARPGERSRRLMPDELVAADPDILVVAACGWTIERTMREVPQWLAGPVIGALRAVRRSNVFVTDGSAFFSRPGPRLIESAEILSRILATADSSAGSDPRFVRVG